MSAGAFFITQRSGAIHKDFEMIALLAIFTAMLLDPVIIIAAVLVGVNVKSKLAIIGLMAIPAFLVTSYLHGDKMLPLDYLLLNFGLRMLAASAWGLAAHNIKLRWIRRREQKYGGDHDDRL